MQINTLSKPNLIWLGDLNFLLYTIIKVYSKKLIKIVIPYCIQSFTNWGFYELDAQWCVYSCPAKRLSSEWNTTWDTCGLT